jgi:biotin operon repressor
VLKFAGMRKISMVALLALPLCARLHAQDPLAAAVAQYEHEPDPIRKAKELAKFGDDQISLASRQFKSGDDVGSLHTLEQYRDEVLATFQALKATGVNVEKKPAGFKELQISLRQTTRHMDGLIFTIPVDKRPFFQEVRADIGRMQNDLMDVLFPRKPHQDAKKPNP